VEEINGGGRTASTGWSQGRLLEGGIFNSWKRSHQYGRSVWERVKDSRGKNDMFQGHVARKIPFGGRNARRSVWLRINRVGGRGGLDFLCLMGFLKGFVVSS